MRSDASQARHAINHIACKMKSIQIVQDRHVEWVCCSPFFFVAVNVKIVVIGAAIREAVNQRRISVISKDDGAYQS